MNKFEDILAKVNSIKMYKALENGLYYAEIYDENNMFFDCRAGNLEALFDKILRKIS